MPIVKMDELEAKERVSKLLLSMNIRRNAETS
jgi:hypothetical protein